MEYNVDYNTGYVIKSINRGSTMKQCLSSTGIILLLALAVAIVSSTITTTVTTTDETAKDDNQHVMAEAEYEEPSHFFEFNQKKQKFKNTKLDSQKFGKLKLCI